MLTHPQPFLTALFHALERVGVHVNDLDLDHLCYRVESNARYAELKAVLAEQGTLLAESTIGGRPIATYRLHAPFHFGERHIEVIELPAPKLQRPYPEGWEHAEFVVTEDLLQFVQRYPLATWDLSDLHEPINADVRLRFGGSSVKFHRQRLDAVIAAELRTTPR